MWECRCGLEVDDRYEACTYCGTRRGEAAKKVNELANTQNCGSDAPVPSLEFPAASVIVGAFAGLMVGYLLGPTIPLIGGRLPFFVVLTAGTKLTGFDEMLRGLAQQAFATLVVCVGIGCVCGFVVGKAQSRRVVAPTIPSPQPQSGILTAGFCTSCGAALSKDAHFCAACGTRQVQS